jgi:hypothetical protein
LSAVRIGQALCKVFIIRNAPITIKNKVILIDHSYRLGIPKISAFMTAAVLLLFVAAKAQVSYTFAFTGSVQTYTVPSCVTAVSLSAFGARGGSNAGGLAGGAGGSAFGVLTVTPGDILYIYVDQEHRVWKVIVDND